VNWYREWDLRELGAQAEGKSLTNKYWKEDSHIFIAEFHKTVVEKVEGDGSLWCHYFWYTENGKKTKQNFRLHADVPVIERIHKPADPVARVYFRKGGRDVGYVTAQTGQNGNFWDAWLLQSDGETDAVAGGSGVTLDEARELILGAT